MTAKSSCSRAIVGSLGERADGNSAVGRSLSESSCTDWEATCRRTLSECTGRSSLGSKVLRSLRRLAIIVVVVVRFPVVVAVSVSICVVSCSLGTSSRSVVWRIIKLGLTFVLDFGHESTVAFHPIGDDLSPSVGQEDAIRSCHHLTIARLLVAVIVLRRFVFHRPRELIRHSLLVLNTIFSSK